MKKFTVLTIVFFLYLTNYAQKTADQIHRDAFTLDSHCDTPLRLMTAGFDLSQSHDAHTTGSKYDFPRMKAGGLDASFFAVYIGQGPRDSVSLEKAFKNADKILDSVTSAVKANAALASLAFTSNDGPKLEKDSKLAIYLGIENGYAIGNKISNLDYFYQKGIRYVTLVHTKNNDLSDSSNDKNGPEFNGISKLGEEMIKRMNQLGILVDVSHASDSAFYDVLKISKTPVIASHSCARALCDNPRNLTDEMLKALAKNNGVIQMCILSDYVKKSPPNPARDSARAAFRAKHGNFDNYSDEDRKNAILEWQENDLKYPGVLATVSDVADHIDHIVKVAGIDHVGIGTDFDGGGGVEGCFDVSEMGNITAELVKRGYSETEIHKIWSGNFLRVFKEVEEYARKQ